MDARYDYNTVYRYLDMFVFSFMISLVPAKLADMISLIIACSGDIHRLIQNIPVVIYFSTLVILG
jgi:hypothetical protein